MSSVKHSDYIYEVDKESNTAAAHVIRMVGSDKYVLELGPGPGSITKHLYQDNNCRIKAIEIDSSSIVKLQQYCEHVYQFNLNNNEWTGLLGKNDRFDVIVAADVLEHLYDPWSTLLEIKKFLSKDGYMVISIPHIGHSAIMACLYNGNFDYKDWGLLDRTHIRFFGMDNIQDLVEKAGLRIKEANFVVVPAEETEFSSHWKKLSGSARKVFSSGKYSNVYQVVIKAVPGERLNKSIILNKMAIPVPKKSIKERIKSIIRPFIPPSVRKILRKFINYVMKRNP